MYLTDKIGQILRAGLRRKKYKVVKNNKVLISDMASGKQQRVMQTGTQYPDSIGVDFNLAF